ncbi:MAG: aminopeptidase [Melioribacteraceae bacterium]|nr:aminopeptidase [Melioribacteraceae bacterium]
MENLISEKDLNTWADYLINYSLGGVTPEDIVMVKGENICWPLMSVLQDKIFALGAIADINITAPDNDRGKVWGSSMARYGSLEQISRIPKWQEERYNNFTKYIEILGASNPELFKNQKDELSQAIMRVDEPLKNTRIAKNWVISLYPTQGFADLEGLSLEDYTNVIVNAATVNPELLEDIEEDIANLMDKSKTIRIETEHPDSGKLLSLSMSISDHGIVKCTGKRNFPDGEVYTSPDSNSVEGEIFVDLPIFQGGAIIQGIYLKFERGKIIEYSAKEENEVLTKIIETDEGSHRIGEVALGMNNGIEKVLKHPLFVEKIGGTLHIAIGASYPNCFKIDNDRNLDYYIDNGIMNKSAQHVDIVTDFRPGGSGRAVYLDDLKLEQKNNIWVVPK